MAEARVFEYEVREADGSVTKGKIEAHNQAAVASRLRSLGVAPLSIKEVSTTGLNAEVRIPGIGGGKVKLKDLAVVTRQIATMIGAGLSLLRTLTIVAEQSENPTLAKVLGQVRGDVESGQSLSSSVAAHKDVFPPLMINMIRAGEVGGFLEDALVSVASNFESEVKLRGQVKSAMTYPLIVFIMAIVAVIGMLIFIVPIFKDMFTEMGGELPGPTQMLVTMSEAMPIVLPVLVVAILVFAWWWGKNKNSDAVRSVYQPFTLRIPVFGGLLKKIAISRFTRNLGTMISSGVPILQALDIVGETSGQWSVEVAVRDVKESVREGKSLAGPLAKHAVFPPMVVQMVATGEDSGSLDSMLAKISDFYDAEVEATTAQLTSLIEPMMIAFLGVVVGGMIVSLYLPIFSIMDLVQ
ncbi:MAG: type II secretion system F family protein [Micrococcales bacterium]|nr:type II secretion system F family protein [Micrococcales bacterium]